MEWGEEFVVSISSKLAREGMMRLCVEIRLDADSDKLWAVQSGMFAARLFALFLPLSTHPASFPTPLACMPASFSPSLDLMPARAPLPHSIAPAASLTGLMPHLPCHAAPSDTGLLSFAALRSKHSLNPQP